ncbi:MAG: hypothetical protein IJZ47_08010 [Oscillospiraceae bacterium]|nr:hypothetical protein [Oscillospiraceae bacterium]
MADCAEMRERMGIVETNLKHNNERLERVEKNTEAIYQLATSVEVVANEMKNTTKRLDSMDKKIGEVTNGQKELSKKVDEVSLAPIREDAAKWKKVVGAVLGALGSAVIGYLIATIIPVLG